MGARAYPTGSINITDEFYLHNVRLSKNGNYVKVTQNTCGPSPGGCTGNTNTYVWELSTLTVNRIVADGTNGCGHNAIGQVYTVNDCAGFQTRPFTSNDQAGTVFITQVPALYPGLDGHLSAGAQNSTDTLPYFETLEGDVGLVANYAWDNEIVGLRNDGSGQAYRFVHNYDTSLTSGTSLRAIGSPSSDGKFYMWASDWDGMLGSTVGLNSCTLGSNCRTDVFIAILPTLIALPPSPPTKLSILLMAKGNP
jgi:hypothetical protein